MRVAHQKLNPVLAFLLLFTAGAAAGQQTAPAPAPSRPGPPGVEALDYAFRFASVIKNDAKDRATAQELALDEYLSAGDYDEVARRAAEIEGWRRGVVYADLASALARDGRNVEARSNVDKAEAVRNTVEGWQNPRISAHVAEALAVLGEKEKAGEITTKLAEADPLQYAGRATATDAVALAVQGDFEAAMKALDRLEGNDDLEVAWWRTSGYLALTRRENAPKPSRLAALDAARASSGVLPIERRVEAQLQIAEQYALLDRRKEGRALVDSALSLVDSDDLGASEKLPFLIEIGRTWSRLGEPGRGRQALRKSEGLVDKALSIDQPGLLARIASGYRGIPDAPGARRLDTQAIDAAARMPLSRPRALALSAICRQLGSDRVVLDQVLRSRLDQLLAGLGDPW